MTSKPEFYRCEYWKRTADPKVDEACEASEAYRVEVKMPSKQYGWQSCYSAEFELPKQNYQFETYLRNIRRAFEMGQAERQREVAETLRGLLNPWGSL